MENSKTKFIKLWENGTKAKDIAKIFGISIQAVNYRRKKLGLPPRKTGRPEIIFKK